MTEVNLLSKFKNLFTKGTKGTKGNEVLIEDSKVSEILKKVLEYLKDDYWECNWNMNLSDNEINKIDRELPKCIKVYKIDKFTDTDKKDCVVILFILTGKLAKTEGKWAKAIINDKGNLISISASEWLFPIEFSMINKKES